MKKFIVEVTRTDKYTIELDENIINEEWLKGYSKFFRDVDSLEEIAEILAKRVACNPDEDFMEGFGYVKQNGALLNRLYFKEAIEAAPGINICLEDVGNIECEINEIIIEAGK